ncbi:MAG: outer membrane beta-barrel protein [Terracidiphilus sp.]
MRIRYLHRVVVWTGLFAAIAASAPAQTDVALSLYGAFTGTTQGNGVTQSPANQAGGMVELRHIVNPLVGYEATYSYNRANQQYVYQVPVPCNPQGVNCLIPAESTVANNAHEITGDWVFSLKVANLRPFALAGGGLLVNVPSSANVSGCYVMNPLCLTSPAPTQTSTTGVFVYGAGLDWGLLPHLGLRLQYRGNVYKAPDLINAFQSTNSFLHTAEPMIGAYFRF